MFLATPCYKWAQTLKLKYNAECFTNVTTLRILPLGPKLRQPCGTLRTWVLGASEQGLTWVLTVDLVSSACVPPGKSFGGFQRLRSVIRRAVAVKLDGLNTEVLQPYQSHDGLPKQKNGRSRHLKKMEPKSAHSLNISLSQATLISRK